MTASSRAALSRAAALSLAASSLVVGSLAVAAPASAHDRLVSSDPAAEATVAELPDEFTLVYSGELIDADDGTAVEVRSPSGDDVASDAPVVDGTDVTVPVDDPGEAGVYTVTWRVVSNDGHPIDGTFEFTSEGASDDAAGEGSSEESPSASPSDGDGSASGGDEPTDSESAAPAPAEDEAGVSPVWILVGVGALVVVAGVVVAAVVVSRRGSGSDDDERDDPDDDGR
ncbi:MAG: copper resistance CopC family protein [Microbacterium sp.]